MVWNSCAGAAKWCGKAVPTAHVCVTVSHCQLSRSLGGQPIDGRQADKRRTFEPDGSRDGQLTLSRSRSSSPTILAPPLPSVSLARYGQLTAQRHEDVFALEFLEPPGSTRLNEMTR